MNDLLETRVLNVYLQLKFNEKQNDYLTQKLVFFIRSLVERNKLPLEKVKKLAYCKKK